MRQRIGLHFIALAAVVLLSAPVARAGFIYVSQARSVYGETSGNLGSASDTITAPNFGVFNATTDVSHPTYGGFADQHQRSELLPGSISVIGDAQLFRPAMVGTGRAITRSITDVTFTVATPTEVELEAVATLNVSGPWGPRTISLTGPGTSINWDVGMSSTWPGSRSTTTTLAPGEYRFLVNLESFTNSMYTASVPSFNVTLTEVVPEPGSFLAGAMLVALLPLSRTRRHRRS